MAKIVKGQLVITERGYVPVEDIGVGDKVLTIDGSYKRVVSKKSDNYTGKLFEVKVNGCYVPVVATGDTKLSVYRGTKDNRGKGELNWLNIAELNERDFVIYPINTEVGADDNKIKYSNLNVARFLGYFALNGFIDWEKEKVVIHIDKVENYSEDIVNACRDGFNLEMERYEYKGEKFLGINSKYLCEMCKDFGDKGNNRRIPEYLINASYGFLYEFIRPLINSKKRDKNFFKSSSSLKFILAYQRILFKLGIFSNVYRCISKDGTFTYYALTFTEMEFKNSFMTETWFRSGNNCYLLVERVFEFNTENTEVYSLKLEGGDTLSSHIFILK